MAAEQSLSSALPSGRAGTVVLACGKARRGDLPVCCPAFPEAAKLAHRFLVFARTHRAQRWLDAVRDVVLPDVRRHRQTAAAFRVLRLERRDAVSGKSAVRAPSRPVDEHLALDGRPVLGTVDEAVPAEER